MADRVLNLLLVEDDEDHYVLTRAFLRDPGALPAELTWLQNRAAALAWLSEHKPDVVLVDLNLPDSCGLETFDAVHVAAPNSAIIVWTGLDDEQTGSVAVQRGAQDYLVKGTVDGPALSRAIRYAVERKRGEKALRQYREHLEDLVEKRTERIRRINENLNSEIAERRKAESELRKAIEMLRENDAARSRFVANASHELKTPLATMSYAIDNLLAGVVGPVHDGFRSYLQMLREDCDRLTHTIEDILDLGRIESHALALFRVKLPLQFLVRRSIAPLYALAAEKRQHLTLHEGVTAFVECDPAKIERVIANVIQNAIKYTPEGGCIDVGLRRHGDGTAEVALDVVDTGIGIPRECLSKVSERYFRVGEHVSGTGLGLAISKELLELHGGRIEVVSPPPGRECGTQVSAFLPLAPPSWMVVLTLSRAIAARIEADLVAEGCAVQSFESGEEALAAMQVRNPGAVFMDFDLIGMDGVEMIARLKSSQELRHVPLIVLASDVLDGVRRELVGGFHLPVLKPDYSKSDLIGMMEKIMISPEWTSPALAAP